MKTWLTIRFLQEHDMTYRGHYLTLERGDTLRVQQGHGDPEGEIDADTAAYLCKEEIAERVGCTFHAEMPPARRSPNLTAID